MDYQEKKTVAQPMDERECKCEFSSNVCCDCRYYSTWNGKGYCDAYHHEISNPHAEKECFRD